MIHTVFFDWSGTLSDDFELVFGAALLMFDQLQLPIISEQEFRREFLLPYMLFWKKYAPQLTKERADKIYNDIIFGESYYALPKPKPFDNATSVLHSLHAQGYQLGVISSHPQKKLEEEMSAYGWLNYFSYTSGSWHNKAHGLLKAMNKMGVCPRHAVYVCDMVHDIEAAKMLTITAVALTWGYDSREKLQQANPCHIIDQIQDLPAILSQI